MSRLIFIRNHSIQDCIFNSTLQNSDLTTRFQAENLHNFFSAHRWLEVADTIFLFQILQFLSNQLEIIQETLFTFHILGSNIRFAKHHQVVNVITRFKEQTAYSRVCHHVIRDNDRAHVQADQLLYILHLLIHRQLHLAEDMRNHLFTDKVMIMERPSRFRFPTFRGRFGNVVQQSSPTQPKVISLLADIIQHFQRMIKIILVRTPVPCFHPLQGSKFRKNQRQQTATLQINKSF